MPLTRRLLTPLLLAAVLLTAAPPVLAQTAPAPAPTTTGPSDQDLTALRDQLLTQLRLTPTLTRVVAADPSLLANQAYIANANPQLAQFLLQHPEITRNPDFYLFAELPNRPGRHAERLQRNLGWVSSSNDEGPGWRTLQSSLGAILFLIVVGIFLWLIRLLLQNRRWTRVFRLQSEIHSKLIDRFTSSQELLQYMTTEPGKRFLEAAPIPVEFAHDKRLPAPLTRVLAPLQIGIVLTLLGAGLLALRLTLSDIAAPLLVFGVILLTPGLGFIISAWITWIITARLGLMPQPTDPSNRQ